MAAAAAQRLYLKENVDADLCYLWDENDLTLPHQFAIAQHYKSMRKFAALGDTRNEVRIAFIADLALDPAAAAPAGVKGRLLCNSEEFRMKLRIEAHTWLMMAAKLRSKTWLVGLTAADFCRFTDYILGDKVLRMRVPDGLGEGHRSVGLNPPWGVVLAYEFQVRKSAFTLIREEGRTMAEGLALASATATVAAVEAVLPSAPLHVIKVLYVFAGLKRESDLRDCLESLQSQHKFLLEMREVDLCRGQHDDVTDEKVWQEIMLSIEAGVWSIVIMTPPCHTHSRARHAWRASPGPTPLRSRKWPKGFPWLRGDKLLQVQEANIFVEKTIEACRGADKAGSFFFTEHPDDLGIAADLELSAAIWQLPEVHSLATDSGAVTFALRQCDDFGLGLPTAETSKPTRCLSTLPGAAKQPYKGWACLRQSGVYAGPLPRLRGHRHFQLLGSCKTRPGQFKTSAAASYPPAMCMMLALMIVEGCLSKQQAPTLLLKKGEEPAAEVATATLSAEMVNAVNGEARCEPVEVANATLSAGEPVEVASATLSAKMVRAVNGEAWGEPVEVANATLSAEMVNAVNGEARGLQLAQPAPTEELEDDSQKEQSEEPSSDEEPDSTGVGPPVQVDWGGRVRELTDGFGLCSPTRWRPKDRHVRSAFTEQLRDTVLKHVNKWWPETTKTVMFLAVGKEIHKPSEEELGLLREDWFRLLPDPEMASKLPAFQPFFLHAMAQTADLQGDPDWRVLDRVKDSYAEGVPVGFQEKMPRVPAVFRRKIRWRKVNEACLNTDMDNYSSAALAGDALRKSFVEESKLGMMFETTLTLAKEQFKDSLRIAALGAIEKSDDSFGILFDGTHGVKLNNDIKPRDQLDFPMGSDAGTQLAHSKEDMPGAHFAIAADVSKAHRRFKHAVRDWGLLTCRDNGAATGDMVWINRVGTFGVASAAYWWGRSFCWQSLFADDLVILAGGQDKWLSILLIIAAWLMVGTPLAWHKFRGGLATDWVGYYLDMQTFSVGISLARAQLLTRWAVQVHQDGMADMRRFAEALGRLGFAAQVLLWAKTFLAPLDAWSAAAPSEATIRVPKMIRLTVLFLEEQLKDGRHMLPCRKLWRDHGEWFRADAKCDPDKVVLGGWVCKEGTPTSRASWFSLTLTKVQVPWLFKTDKGSSWASTSAELLATIVAIQAFDISCETGGTAVTRISAGTDNQANDRLSRKMSSTKMPLGLLLMQLAMTLSLRRLQLHLDLRPREENSEADDLTNDRFSDFDETKRILISWEQVDKSLLEKLLLCQEEYEDELRASQEERGTSAQEKGKRKEMPD
ncbi:unnamed protein product [Polarella glacialis]|uniref:Uncharacterized protein n=1 Tax=Polarella glacialis TaxID=89957 RepID=A0A813HNN1_POLGL|nr:unnamed protein product [Polarella glacialis]